MGQVLGDVLGLAAGVAVSPLPIIALIIVLATPHGRVNGLVFTAGWVVGLSVLGGVMLAIGGQGDAESDGQPAVWVGALKLALGLALALFGVKLWRHRPADATQARLPAWMATIDRFTPVKIFLLALLLSAGNLKNAPLTIAAAASISSSGLPVGQQIAALAIFVVIASLGLLAPLVVYLVMRERARGTLGNWKEWAARHNTAVMAVLFFVFGLKLLGDGIDVLVS
ncbi:Threonine/homoserine/homoserine lactone efflux protein [Streptomyces sp. 1222.5]|uniref:GAP family protein n=1 Tax=unclassified Streptomyces TaxID=2593676 RepID=UPI0008978800|nr:MULTISPECIES: GAP family protein [unclassified Streptomyces]PKW07791.1 threonine/homoserine/homoserine lactone efflux protein [Streptomyces sp. 5112.2]SEC79744.1 Threonine/homoserine/homoserine lactone efflux protein [Streptomyces sp. 1222.5]